MISSFCWLCLHLFWWLHLQRFFWCIFRLQPCLRSYSTIFCHRSCNRLLILVCRLQEIEAIVNGLDTQNLKATYDGYIKKGDDALTEKNSSVARFYFEKASILKPDEKYPKEKIKLIDAGM